MYEPFFGMEHTPFVRDIPAEKLYESDAFRETLGRLCYVADRQMFAVVTADPGCGKSTLIRRFYSELPREEYIMQTATFCGQQGRISRTVRAILSGQPGISAGQRVLRPTDQYYSLFQKKAMLSQSVQ